MCYVNVLLTYLDDSGPYFDYYIYLFELFSINIFHFMYYFFRITLSILLLNLSNLLLNLYL